MKICPICHKSYEDNSMVFCLDDGARLSEAGMPATDPNATLHLPSPRVTEPEPTVASPQSTMRYQPEMIALNPPAFAAPNAEGRDTSRRSALPWLLAIAIVLGIFGVLIALILSFGRNGANQQTGPTSTPMPAPTQSSEMRTQSDESPSPSRGQAAAPTPATKLPERPPKKQTEEAISGSTTAKPMFGPVLNNISFNGTRITYYPRPSYGLCKADCAANANCKGFTWIRPGAYNQGDSAMCYLMSAVTARIPHSCCVSGVKN